MSSNGLDVKSIVMSGFVTGKIGSSFIVLSNKGFHRIFSKKTFGQMSIDKIDGLGSFKEILGHVLEDTILKSHIENMHDGTQAQYFK